MSRFIAILLCASLFLVAFSMLPAGMHQDASVENAVSADTRATLTVGVGQTYTTIGAAVTAATAGDTIRVYAGMYNEKVIIGKTLTMIGNGSSKTVINATGSGVPLTINANWCNITGFKITGAGSNGAVVSSNYNNISSCNVTQNIGGSGIFVTGNFNKVFRVNSTKDQTGLGIIGNNATVKYYNGSSNTFTGLSLGSFGSTTSNDDNITFCTLSDNGWDGINMQYTKRSNLNNNTIARNLRNGVYMSNCVNNKFRDNHLTSCGFVLYGGSVAQYMNDMDTSNKVNNKPFQYWTNKNSGTLSTPAGQVYLINCQNVQAKDQDVSKASVGLEVIYSNNCKVFNITSNNNYNGMIVSDSPYTRVENCSLDTAENYGIYFRNSNDCLLANSSVSHATAEGAYFLTCANERVSGCNFSFNLNRGLRFDNTPNNMVDNTTCLMNADSGIATNGATDFTDCNLRSNEQAGINLATSGSNVIRSTFSSNGMEGLVTSGSNNLIDSCVFTGHPNIGVSISSGNRNTVKGCEFDANNIGVYLSSSSLTSVSNNTITNSTKYGVWVYMASSNVVSYNTIYDSADFGISVTINSHDNVFHHNTLLYNRNNQTQAADNGSANDWNTSIGNYWSDWLSPDADGNGIVDVPYAINGTAKAKDFFPICPTILTPLNLTPYEDVPYYQTCAFENTYEPMQFVMASNASWLTLLPNGTIFGTPQNADVGVYWLSVRSDSVSFNTTYNLTLTVKNVNDPPTIDAYTVPICKEDASFKMDLNATDIDPTHDLLVWSVHTNATWLSVNATSGELTGIPLNSDTHGEFVNVTVSDQKGDSAWANFTLTPVNVNDPPAIIGAGIADAYEDSLYFVLFDVTDEDLDDVLFTWALDSNATWLSIDVWGNLSGIPANDDVGSYWANVSVADGHSAYRYYNFTLTVHNVNDAPIWDSVPGDVTINDTEDFYFDTNASDIDIGDVVTYNISSEPAVVMFIDPSTGEIEWNAPHAPGVYVVTVNAIDSATWTPYSFNITVVHLDIPPFSDLVSPANGSKLSNLNPEFEWTVTDTDSTNVTSDLYLSQSLADVQNFASGAHVGPGLTVLSFTMASPLEAGKKYYWTVMTSDGINTGGCRSGIWSFETNSDATINGTNSPPTFTSSWPTTATVGKEWTYTPTVSDPDIGSMVTISYVDGPDGMEFVGGRLSWTPTEAQIGEQTVSLSATDGKATVYQNFTVTVQKAGGDDDDDTNNMTLLIIIAVIVAVIIIVVAIVAFMLFKKRQAEPEAAPKADALEPEIGNDEVFDKKKSSAQPGPVATGAPQAWNISDTTPIQGAAPPEQIPSEAGAEGSIAPQQLPSAATGEEGLRPALNPKDLPELPPSTLPEDEAALAEDAQMQETPGLMIDPTADEANAEGAAPARTTTQPIGKK